MITILQGDVLEQLHTLPDKSVQCCVTSPPYYGLRNYGVKGQIGLEDTPEAFVEKIVEVFHEVKRVLRDDGTLWLNFGDSYCANGGGGERRMIELGRPSENALSKPYQLCDKKKSSDIGLKPKDMIGIPWMVAFALRADGWYLRSDIIWSKPNPMPESVTDRPTKAHEYVFLMSKKAKYYYDADAVREPVAESTIGRGPVDFGGAKGREYKETIQKDDPNYRNGNEQWGRTFDYKESCKNGRNRRTVWEIATQPTRDAHFATFPEALVEPCIKAGSKQGDTILDPFGGSGTTAKVARDLKRDCILIELNPKYIGIAREKLRLNEQLVNRR